MEIPLNASLVGKCDGAEEVPLGESGGGFGSRDDAMYREALDDLLEQVKGKSDFDNAYASFSMAGRALVKLGMPYQLLMEYQDLVVAHYKKLQEPVAPVTHIEAQHIQKQNNIGSQVGSVVGDITSQNVDMAKLLNQPTDPKLLE